MHHYRVPRRTKAVIVGTAVRSEGDPHVACGRRDALDISIRARQLSELLLLRALHV
jgi:hypothetical protein